MFRLAVLAVPAFFAVSLLSVPAVAAPPPTPGNCVFERGVTSCTQVVNVVAETVHTNRRCLFGIGHIDETVAIVTFRTTEYRGRAHERNISHLPVATTTEWTERIVEGQECVEPHP